MVLSTLSIRNLSFPKTALAKPEHNGTRY